MSSVPEDNRQPATPLNITGGMMLGNLGVLLDNTTPTAAIIPFQLLHDMGLGAVQREIERRLLVAAEQEIAQRLDKHEAGERK